MTSIHNPNAGLDFSYMTPVWLAAEQRRDTIHDRARTACIADAQARGVTGLRCDACGARHSLNMIGDHCNAAHLDADNHDGEVCGHWNLSEIKGGAA